MATRQFLIDNSVSNDGGTIAVTWTGLLNGDVGASLGKPQWSERTVQVVGTFGVGGSVTMQGSNDGVNWVALVNRSGTALTFTAQGMNRTQDYPIYVRPIVTAGDGSTNLTVIVAAHRFDLTGQG